MGAQAAPKGAPRNAKATKMVPKVVQKASKSALKRLFFEISKTLNLNDSTMIFMVFWCPGGSPGRPKNKKMDVHGAAYGCKGAADASY